MRFDTNPFPATDSERYAIWEMLVRRDFEAFLTRNWSLIADDFIAESFVGIDARGSDNPQDWSLTYPDLDHYRQSWLQQSDKIVGQKFTGDLRQELYRLTRLDDIQLDGNSALAHKKFDGAIALEGGESIELKWQTLYCCRKVRGEWKILNFVGYLPNPMGKYR